MERDFYLTMRARTPAQRKLHSLNKRFRVGIFGRQSGKTTYGTDAMTVRPLMGRPEGIYWYVLQTSDAAEIGFNRHWRDLQDSTGLLKCKPHETQRLITLINGSQIFYKSGEVLEDLRAETLDGCVIDEYRQQYPELWPTIIRPMLARRKGWCDFLTTPNGFDHCKDLYDFALAHPDEWGAVHSPSWEAPWWDPQEIESARDSMTEDEFAQELGAEFRNIHTGKAYKSHSPANQRMSSPFCIQGELVSEYLPVVVGLDFNVNPMSWELGQLHADESYWFDEIHVANTNTTECAVELVMKLLDLRAQKKLNGRPNVILCGDATGESRNSKATESDYAIICNALTAAKITWENRTPKVNPPVKSRVNMVNAKLRSANAGTKLFYHPQRCKWLKTDFERVAWKQGALVILDQKVKVEGYTLTHPSDAVGYVICEMQPIDLVGGVGTMKVVKR